LHLTSGCNCGRLEAPDTRASLLAGPAEKGFGREQLAEMQKIIDAETKAPITIELGNGIM
jgi:hypothetical protein